ncbi:hypothetical protein FA15DRAFT_705955 [Coprinopsis marcescibilis]|uniref:Uncharacterized protein n=1 Tax=Coprinopsis marcescibilis TaxID=230819 RepID=A0A5C3KR45_COPMA|nr:hypothetical protein FA15DRAFT_705955 [Coprinopsis marcescibilis]
MSNASAASQVSASVSTVSTLSTTMSSTELARAHYIQNGGSADALRKALGAAHIDLQTLKAENQALTEENTTLKSQLRLATHQKKTRAKGSTKSKEELAAAHLGNIFMVFFNMCWDIDMFGPALVGYDHDDGQYNTPGAYSNYVRWQLYQLVPKKYHNELVNEISLFVVTSEKSGRTMRTQTFTQTRSTLLTILGDKYPHQLKPSLFLKSTECSEEREQCEDLRFLLGHDGSSSDGPGTHCPYPIYPPVLFENFDVDNPAAFMRGETFYQLGRLVAYGKSSIASVRSIREQSNSALSSPDLDHHSTTGFIAGLGIILVFVLSPDKEFPNTGIGAISRIRYYDLYLAFKNSIHAIELAKVNGGLKAVYNSQVFPKYVPGAPSGTQEASRSPVNAAVAQFRMQPAVSKMMWAIKALTDSPGASQSPSPLLAQPTLIIEENDDDDSFYAQDSDATTTALAHPTDQSGLEGALTSMSLSADATDGTADLGTGTLDREATVRPDNLGPVRRGGARRSKANAPAPAPTRRTTRAAAKST